MKKLVSFLLALTLALGLSAGVYADSETTAPNPDAPGTVSFENIESRMRANSPSVLALTESAASLESIDYEMMTGTLKDSLSDLADALFLMASYGSSDSYQFSALQSAQESVSDTLETLTDGTFRRDNELTIHQMQHLANQVIFGAQSVYITIYTYEQQLADGVRGLAALDRTLATMEKSYQLGQISELSLMQMKSTRTTTASNLESLRMAIANLKSNLLSMLGEDPTGELTLNGLPEVPADAVAAINYETDLAAAQEKSYDLHAADVQLEKAQDTWEDAAEDYHYGTFVGTRYQYEMAQHTWQAAQNTHTASYQSFTLTFLQLYRSIGNYQQVLDAAQQALDYQEKSFASSQLQYERGMISYNDLMDAEDDLYTARSAVTTAKINYYTAWNQYTWAVQTGLVS